MGVTSLPVVLTAIAVALLLSAFPFRLAPRPIQDVFFRRDGTWRRFGREIWLGALLALLLIAVLVTPRA